MLEAAIVIGGVVNGPIIGIFTAGPRQPPQHHSLLQFSPILFTSIEISIFIDIGFPIFRNAPALGGLARSSHWVSNKIFHVQLDLTDIDIGKTDKH